MNHAKGEVRKGLLTSVNHLSRKVHSFHVPIFLFIQQIHDAPVTTSIVKNAALRVQQAIEPGKVDRMSKDFSSACPLPIRNLIMKMEQDCLLTEYDMLIVVSFR